MSNRPQAPDLGQLKARYDIVGELRGTDDTRTYVGRRRDGGTGDKVVIMVARAIPGDQSNGLSHFAADTQLLSTLKHPSLAHVIDGIWLGNDAFARVTEPINGTSLGQRLASGEKLANPRIASVLQDVHGVLDWARGQGVVHRGVTLDTLFFEPDTERVCMALKPMPIPMGGVPDACADATTIGTLAWAMLSGKPYEPGAKSLAALAPNLATRVIDATERMVGCKSGGETPDVMAFLSMIASADVLKQSEVEMAALQEQYGEEHRRELAKCEDQRAAIERQATEQTALLAGEREEFKRSSADERAAIAAERAEFESAAIERQRRLAEVRAELEEQRSALERRLAELDAHRAKLEQYRSDFEQYRVDVERIRSEAIAAGAALPTPPVEPVLQPMSRREKKAGERSQRAVERKLSSAVTADADRGGHHWLRFATLAVLILVAVAALIGYRERRILRPVAIGRTKVVPTAPTNPTGTVPNGGFLSQSAGGSVAPNNGSPLLPHGGARDSAVDTAAAHSVTTDTAATAPTTPAAPAAASPSQAEPRTYHATPPKVQDDIPTPRPTPIPVDTQPARMPASIPTPPPTPVDSNASKPIYPNPHPMDPQRDSVAAPVPPAPPRSDTVYRHGPTVRADTVYKRDTTGFRRDTIGPPH